MSGFDSSDEEFPEQCDRSPYSFDCLDVSEIEHEKVAIGALPGCRYKNTWRSIQSDIGSLKNQEVTDVFVLCTKGELNKYRVPGLLSELSANDLTVHHYPFLDGQTPTVPVLMKMLDELQTTFNEDKLSLIHCYGGLGRSCLVAVCLLMLRDKNITPESAIQKLRDLRGPAAIQSVKQYNFIYDFRQHMSEHAQAAEDFSRTVSR